MKKLLTIIILVLCTVLLQAQDRHNIKQKNEYKFFRSSPVFFDEIYLSSNFVTYRLLDKDIKHPIGLGIAFHKVIPFKNDISFVTGLEYNLSRLRTTYYNSKISLQSFTHSYLHTIDLPLLFRYNFNTNINLFIEAGMFFGISTPFSRGIEDWPRFGLIITYHLRNYIFTGPQAGIGCKIPIGKIDLLFKLDYRHDFMVKYYEKKYVPKQVGTKELLPDYYFLHTSCLRFNIGIGF